MKRILALLTLSPAAAFAHGLPGPHAHPHLDPASLMLVLGVAAAVVALAVWRRP